MKLKRILYTAAFATMGLSLNSCSDYLDVSKELMVRSHLRYHAQLFRNRIGRNQ